MSKQKLKVRKTGKTAILEKVRFSQITNGIRVIVRDFNTNKEDEFLFGSIDRFYEEFEPLDEIKQ